ncbi:undecaprenyl-diphosphate phosphatase [Tropicibacter sp. R15_0]|uniref:undecaprenyl-diphosphate phosphatase n=1 Tax=Tropicibacter sp. R15_0 TaxID=2821101 RepID=UPI001ADD4058|nr:undecaprenyl-diphosphate phosphatase [Tropicibacter sp. R15_0]MBO9464349.1 undecaprenyl-diphosphate phosphatase [Tropicibacter sp. R15_0]
MTYTYLLILALIQGITEFLPISSSGHLILASQLSGQPDQGLAIDVAVHVGTLLAVILYFWQDCKSVLTGLPRLLTGRIDTPGSRLAFLLVIATIPVVIAGLILKLTGLSDMMRSTAVIGWSMLGFGLVLYWADQTSAADKVETDWSLRDAITMGLWQALALIPGTSRSGITITGALKLGYARHDAAKLSMLMSIPTIIASGTLLGLDLASSANAQLARDGAIAAAMAFVSALAALAIMMRLLRSVSFTPYVIYRVIFGALLLYIAYS